MIRKHLKDALQTAENRNDIEAQIKLLGALGTTYAHGGDTGFAIDLFRQAVTMFCRTGNPTIVGITSGNFGSVLYNAGEYDEAEQHLQKAMDIAEQTGNADHLRTRVANLGRVYRAMGGFADAERLLSHAMAIAAEQSDSAAANLARLSLSKTRVDAGRLELAKTEALGVLDTSLQLETSRMEIQALLVLGEIDSRARETGTALERLEKAVALARRDGGFGDELEAHSLLAETHADTCGHDNALKHLKIAWDLHERSPRAAIEAELSRTSCKVHAAAGRSEQAAEFGERAVSMFRKLNGPLRLGRSLDYLGDAYATSGDSAAARSHWTEALGIFDRLGVSEAETLRQKLGLIEPSR